MKTLIVAFILFCLALPGCYTEWHESEHHHHHHHHHRHHCCVELDRQAQDRQQAAAPHEDAEIIALAELSK